MYVIAESLCCTPGAKLIISIVCQLKKIKNTIRDCVSGNRPLLILLILWILSLMWNTVIEIAFSPKSLRRDLSLDTWVCCYSPKKRCNRSSFHCNFGCLDLESKVWRSNCVFTYFDFDIVISKCSIPHLYIFLLYIFWNISNFIWLSHNKCSKNIWCMVKAVFHDLMHSWMYMSVRYGKIDDR